MKFQILGLIAILAAVSFWGGCKCNCEEKECLCTEIFVSYHVTVTDEAGLPLENATVRVWFEATGEVIDCSDIHVPDKGLYCIMSDTYRKQLDEDGESVVVRFTAPGYKAFSGNYLFNTDSCQCHIRHIYGPDTVTMEKI